MIAESSVVGTGSETIENTNPAVGDEKLKSTLTRLECDQTCLVGLRVFIDIAMQLPEGRSELTS